MRRRAILIWAAGLAVSVAALGQTPISKQSSSPTSNEFRMRVLEPTAGAAITGNDFNVVIGTQPEFPAGTSVNPQERRDALRPTYQVWVDGKDLGNIPPSENVLAVHTDAFGPHQLVIVAKNGTGQEIDRQQIAFTTVTGGSTQVTTTNEPVAPAPAPPVAAAPPPPAPAPVEAAPAPTTLPKTASSAPLAALAGLALMGAGVGLWRRSF